MTLDDIESAINAAGSDNHEYFGATRTGGYYIQQDPKEFAELVQLLMGFQFDNYMAIGIAAAGVERFICENVKVGALCVIDDAQHPKHRYAIKNLRDINSLVMWGDSHSQDVKRNLEKLGEGGTKFNLVGIDGDHSPQGVLQDWETVQPYLAPGCLVWFHDIHVSEIGQHGARKLWARLKNEHEVLLETNGKFGIGVIRV